MKRILPLPASALVLAVFGTACGGGGEADPSASQQPPSSTTESTTPGQASGPQSQPGQYTAGSATITTTSGQATLDFSEGLYVSANDTVVANFADGVMSDPTTNALGVSGSAAQLSVTLIGPLQSQGVTTECTVHAATVEPSGLEGTFECKGGVSGTFEAH